MASAQQYLDDILEDTSKSVDELAVSALIGSLESQLASPTTNLTSQDISSTHNHVNSISSTNNRIGLATNPCTTDAGCIAPLVTSGSSSAPQQPPISITNSTTTANIASTGNTITSVVSGSSSVGSNVKDGKTRIVTLTSTSSPLNNSTPVTANNIVVSNSNVVIVNAATTSVITSPSPTILTPTISAGGNTSTVTTANVVPLNQQQTSAAFTVTLPGAIPASGYVNQFPSVNVASQPNQIGILQRPTILNGNGPGSIAAALTASKGPSIVQGTTVITTLASSTAPVMSVVPGGPKTGPPIRCTLPSSSIVNTLAMQNATNVTVRQQPLIIPTTPQTTLAQQTQGIQGHPTQTVIAAAKSTASAVTGTPISISQMVSNPQIFQGVQILNMNPVRAGTSPAQVPKTLAPRVVFGTNSVRIGGQPHSMITTKPGTPGALQNTITLPPNMLRGTLFVKTENGQYQVLTALAPGTTTATGRPTYTLQTLPHGSHPSVRVALPGHHPAQSIRMQQPSLVHTVLHNSQQVGNIVTAGTAISHTTTYAGNSAVSVQSPITVSGTRAPAVVSTAAIPVTSTSTGGTQATSTPQMSPDTAKKKCKNFLSTLIRLASDQPEQVATNVKNLIQGLIDGNVLPEDFTNQLQRELNSSPQPCLIPFLKKSLPYLRHSLTTQELTIEGVKPPPLEVQSLPSTTTATITTTCQPVPSAVPHLQMTSTPFPRQTLLHGSRVMFTTNQSVAGNQAHIQHSGEFQTGRLIRPGITINQNQSHSIVPHPSPVITSNRPTLSGSHLTSGIQRMPLVMANAVKSAVMTPSITRVTAPLIVTTASPTITTASSLTKDKEGKRSFASMLKDDDDINDVAAMGGVNLVEESARILAQNAEFVGTQIRSCKDENFLHTLPLQRRIRAMAAKYGLDEPSPEVTAAISHAAQERLKDLVEKLGVVAEHRMEIVKSDGRHEISQDVKGQLKFLEELDRVEKKRHEEQERELLLRAAKSRSKLEDPEQLKLKQKAKEMQRAEMEEMRQREANMTALLAIGPRKKFKVDPNAYSSNSQQATGSGSSPSSGSSALSSSRPQLLRPRVKRVNLRDLMFILEQERSTCRSLTLYKMLLK